MVANNPKLSKFAHHFLEIDPEAKVSLLLGRNVIELMQSNCHTAEAPWEVETPLGWAVVGNPCPKIAGGQKANIGKVLITHEHYLAKDPPLGSPPNPLQKDIFFEHVVF